MFFSFFTELRAAKIPVSLREYLTLMEAMERRVATFDIEEFYFLARAALTGRIGQHVAGLGLALAGTLLLLRPAQPKVIVLQHANRHPHGA